MRRLGGALTGLAAMLVLAACGASSTATPSPSPSAAVVAPPTSPSPVAQAAPSPAPSPAAAGTPRCHTADLQVMVVGSQGATGHIVTTFGFVDTSGHDCTLYGFPGFSMVDAAGNQIGQPAARCTPGATNASPCFAVGQQQPASTVLMKAGAGPPPGTFTVDWTDNCSGGAAPAGPAQFKIYPPDETGAILVAANRATVCPASLEIYPVQP